MFTFASWPLQWARSFGHRFFLQFGLHCATHQIRVILISCVVITSLFYPALDVYTSSRTSSQSIVDTFRSPRSTPLPAEYDLVDLWSGYDTLRVHKDPVTRAKCNNGHALRMERILIQSQLVEDDGALNYKILLSTYDLEHRIHQLISTSDSPCLKKSDSQCIVISPLAFWNYDKDAMGLDANILDTLGYSKNVSIAGIPVTPHMVLAGRGSYEPRVGGANKFDYATYLVLTYFFPRNACWGSGSEHTHWIQVVRDAVGQSGEVDVHVPEATLIALEYVPDRASSAQGQSVISAFLYLAYIGFFAYVVWTVRHMDAIHSRLGITFTALVEIAVSTITSLSVCALVGFKITMVPWEVLPIVIVFVGAENMFNLVDAVGKTSVTLSVKQRIAEGLSRAGTSNTLKVVSYNAILGVIAFFSVGAVRQFCAFAIVVLVAHWFLAHTLFIAVLSIDIARLELEELLRHDTSLAPSVPSLIQNQKDTQNSKKPRSGWQRLIMNIKHLLKGRAATNISLLMLLAIAGTLYYTTYTTSTSLPPPSVSSLQRLGAIARSKKAASKSWSGATAHSFAVPAEQVWKTLNTAQTSLLHLRIEQPVTVTFNPHVESSSASSITTRSRYTMRTSSIVFWLLTIMVVPIAATTGALYGLLLYLLRNTELLEAQRNRLGADDEDDTISAFAKNSNGKVKGKKNFGGEVEFSTLPRVFASDVELVESSKDGRVVVCVGLHNEVVVWDVDSGECIAKTDAADLFLRMLGAGLANGLSLGMMAGPSSSALPNITCVTLDDEGKHLAFGTSSGLFIACSVDRDIGSKHGAAFLRPLALMGPENLTSGVLELRFVESRRKTGGIGRNLPLNGFGSELNSPESKLMKSKVKEDAKAVRLLATYKDGTVARWTIPTNGASKHFLHATYFTPSGHSAIVRVVLLPVLSGDRTLIGFCLDDGTLELIEPGENDRTLSKACVLQGGNPYDLVWKAHACQTEMGGRRRLVVVTATEVGVISLWDGFTGECISILEEGALGKVNQLRVSAVQCETCHFCGQLPMESLSVAFSVDHVVKFEKLYINDTNLATAQSSRRCSCSKASAHLLQKVQGLSRISSTERIMGKRSRSNSSATSTQGSSPLIPRARLATAFESSSSLSTAPSFPVSGHGVHSRRASEKEGMPRRSSELVAVPPFPSSNIVGNAAEYNVASNGDVSSGAAIGTPSAYSIWKNATVAPLMDVTCERGEWDVSGNVYMGIRRKSRSQCQSKNVVSSLSNGSDEGLTNSTLERWEFWRFDPATTTMRFSSLISLVPESTKAKSSSSTSPTRSRKTSRASSRTPFLYTFSSNTSGVPTARLPFTRVSPMRITSSHALAGFGNTIGIFKFTSS